MKHRGADASAREKNAGKAVRRTSIGGQAVIEGVMMKSATSVATAVRTESGEITVEARRLADPAKRALFFRLPFVRGVVNLITQLFMGTGILMRSAEVFGDTAEPTKFDKWAAEKFKINPMHILTAVSLVLGLALAIGLFVFLPNFLTGLIFEIPGTYAHPALYSLCEAAFMLAIFVGYILSVTLMKDIRRVFMYHGAEHKVISCYEHGLELNVQNARKMRTEHSRCGTTFMFFVVAVSIIVFALVNWMLDAVGWMRFDSVVNSLIKLAVKLLFLPVVAGISYEILKFLSKSDCLLFRVLRAPADGPFECVRQIGDIVRAGEVVGRVAGEPMVATIDGALRGLIAPGVTVHAGMKAGDIDPRGDASFCATVSDKATAVGGGVLRDIMVGMVPVVLKSDFYATASLIGGVVYCILVSLGVPVFFTFIIVSLLVIVLRLLGYRYKLQLPVAELSEQDKEE